MNTTKHLFGNISTVVTYHGPSEYRIVITNEKNSWANLVNNQYKYWILGNGATEALVDKRQSCFMNEASFEVAMGNEPALELN